MHHTRFSKQSYFVADIDVISNSNLSGHHDKVAGRTAASDSDLRTKQIVRADRAVVPNHYEVVELRALSDRG